MSEKKIIYCKDLNESKEKYEEYINNHIMAVQEAYRTAENAFKALFPKVYEDYGQVNELLNNLKHHDESKFYYKEFDYYAARFFPVEGTDPNSKEVKDNFDLAWLHHAHSNPHHPSYWSLVDDTVKTYDMPDIYIIEMLCDWMAMSKYYNSTTLEYWESPSAKKLPMTLNTKLKITSFMGWMHNHNVHTLW